jgi:hypothetical protein
MSRTDLKRSTGVAARIQEQEMGEQEMGEQEMGLQGSGRPGERGEGVISTAIAVLIVALLGVALWAGFSTIVDDASTRTSEQIQQIGGGAP